MARSDTLPIFLDTYQLTQEIYKTTVKFPREYKFCLGQEMNRDVLNLLRLIFRANHTVDKVPLLEEFFAALEVLRLEIRLCADMKVLTVKRLAYLSLLVESISKQAVAWCHYETRKKKGV